MTNEEFSERIVAMMQTLYRVSYSQLAKSDERDDAVQECLYKAWKKRHQLRDERFMQTWVIRILINECRNIRKKNARELPKDRLSERAVPPDADYELHDALMNLDERLRLPILLHYMEDYTVKEIAKILSLPQGTVKSRMLRGRKELHESLFPEVKSHAR